MSFCIPTRLTAKISFSTCEFFFFFFGKTDDANGVTVDYTILIFLYFSIRFDQSVALSRLFELRKSFIFGDAAMTFWKVSFRIIEFANRQSFPLVLPKNSRNLWKLWSSHNHCLPYFLFVYRINLTKTECCVTAENKNGESNTANTALLNPKRARCLRDTTVRTANGVADIRFLYVFIFVPFVCCGVFAKEVCRSTF